MEKWKHPENYLGETYYDYYVGPSVHRDSEPLARSNFDAALELLGGEGSGEVTIDGEVCPAVIVQRARHWAVGWLDTIYVHQDAADKLAILQEIENRLEEYPILDEEDLSRREWEEIEESVDNWARGQAIGALGLDEDFEPDEGFDHFVLEHLYHGGNEVILDERALKRDWERRVA